MFDFVARDSVHQPRSLFCAFHFVTAFDGPNFSFDVDLDLRFCDSEGA